MGVHFGVHCHIHAWSPIFLQSNTDLTFVLDICSHCLFPSVIPYFLLVSFTLHCILTTLHWYYVIPHVLLCHHSSSICLLYSLSLSTCTSYLSICFCILTSNSGSDHHSIQVLCTPSLYFSSYINQVSHPLTWSPPSCFSVHLCTSIPPTIWNQGQ